MLILLWSLAFIGALAFGMAIGRFVFAVRDAHDKWNRLCAALGIEQARDNRLGPPDSTDHLRPSSL